MHKLPKPATCSSSYSSSLKWHNSSLTQAVSAFFKYIDSVHSSNVPFDQKIVVLYQSKYLGIDLQAANTVFEKTPLHLSQCFLSRGAIFANVHACVHVSVFGASWRYSFVVTKKNLWNKYKNHKMKGIGMTNEQKRVLPSADVVNDHIHPRPYIVFDPKVVIETCKNYVDGYGDTYNRSLHLHWQFLVPLVFTHLPSLAPFILLYYVL